MAKDGSLKWVSKWVSGTLLCVKKEAIRNYHLKHFHISAKWVSGTLLILLLSISSVMLNYSLVTLEIYIFFKAEPFIQADCNNKP